VIAWRCASTLYLGPVRSKPYDQKTCEYPGKSARPSHSPMLIWNYRSERRHNPRFRVNGDAIVVLKSHPATMGKLIDISMEGLSFRYIHSLERLDQTSVLDIFQSSGGFYLGRTEFVAVSSARISDFVRRFSVRFTGLNRRQRSRLKKFIEDFTIGSA